MISSEFFFNLLKKKGSEFFSGVPDSSLKHLCAYITDHVDKNSHYICANEGNAIGIATGNYLATGKVPIVYMQNSGIGNSINPLLSIADRDVYSIPLLLIIGWRGEPGKIDEPQHKKQGRVLLSMLKSMEIPYEIINSDNQSAKLSIDSAYKHMYKEKSPFALVVKKGIFEPYEMEQTSVSELYSMLREDAIKLVIDSLAPEDIVVSTTGMTSREVFEYRESLNQGHNKDFLIVGGMGHTSQIALGIAVEKNDREVYCLDGDGSVIMHMGSMAINGISGNENFFHIVLNNGAHDSVGGQPTVGHYIDFCSIAEACRYRNIKQVKNSDEIVACLQSAKYVKGPHFIEILLKKGNREGIGRPTTSPIENKNAFMEFLQKDQ